MKQKTAVPQGAASLSLAVLESDGRKREVVIAPGIELGKSGAKRGRPEYCIVEMTDGQLRRARPGCGLPDL